MSCIIGTHVSHLHIRIIFGSLYQIGLHFKADLYKRQRLKDIEEFQKRETRKQAREITLLSQQTSKLQGGLVQNCRELVAAFRKACLLYTSRCV